MDVSEKVSALLKSAKIGISDTTLRDAHQSLWATRMPNKMALGAFPAIDDIGFFSLEVWGGATFDTALRFLGEDPWENLDRLKSKALKTPLQMLLRGQNGVGYSKISNDVLFSFIREAHRSGIDIFRIFDAMNDIRNLENPVRFVREVGGHSQVCASYTESPFHTASYYIKFVETLVEKKILDPDSPNESFCIKDMAGVAKPNIIAQIVSTVRKKYPNLLIQIHCHYCSGLAPVTYFAAVNAGANVIDGAISSMSEFTSLSSVETLSNMFLGTDHEVTLNKNLFGTVSDYFLPYAKERHLSDSHVPVDTGVLEHKIPGGMWSNFIVQLSNMGLNERIQEVLDLFPVVWKKLGFPPLVTPTSQIVGVETALTVLRGEDYERSKQVIDYVNGVYGKPPGEIDKELQKHILGHSETIDYSKPLVIPSDSIDSCREDLKMENLLESERDVISYAMFPTQTLGYLKWKHQEGNSPIETNDPSIGEAENLRRNAASVEDSCQKLFGGISAGSIYYSK